MSDLSDMSGIVKKRIDIRNQMLDGRCHEIVGVFFSRSSKNLFVMREGFRNAVGRD
jgi:hypothetical protein